MISLGYCNFVLNMDIIQGRYTGPKFSILQTKWSSFYSAKLMAQFTRSKSHSLRPQA